MPVLHEKLDGTYCVRTACDGCKTWQIDGKGVRELRRRGLRFENSSRQRNIRFSFALFFELRAAGLIYNGGRYA